MDTTRPMRLSAKAPGGLPTKTPKIAPAMPAPKVSKPSLVGAAPKKPTLVGGKTAKPNKALAGAPAPKAKPKNPKGKFHPTAPNPQPMGKGPLGAPAPGLDDALAAAAAAIPPRG